MTEPPSRPRVSKRITPLAVIIVVIAVGLVILAVVRAQRHVEPLNDDATISAPQNTAPRDTAPRDTAPPNTTENTTENTTTENSETSRSTDL